MTLSIIIPCYKVENYLNKCLESVCQYYTDDIEIILVDDGSPDGTPQLCDQWAEKDSRIKVIHQENGGLSVARNTGLDASSGDYIWFIDSDDWLTEGAIKRVLSLINEYPNIEVFVSPLIWTYEDSRMNWLDIKIDQDSIMSGQQHMSRHHIATGAAPRNIIKHHLLISAGIKFYPKIVHEDALFGLLLYNHAKSVLVLKDSVYHYRQRNDSIMHKIDIKSAYSLVTIHEQLMNYMKEYIAPQNHLNFQRRYIYMFHFAMTMTWHLHNKPEFKKFLADTRDYRISECMKCAERGNSRLQRNMRLLAYHPIIYAYVHGWKSMLFNYTKKITKKCLVKVGVYDYCYDILKGKRNE